MDITVANAPSFTQYLVNIKISAALPNHHKMNIKNIFSFAYFFKEN